eukprot:323930-Rhodomonas_salina.3
MLLPDAEQELLGAEALHFASASAPAPAAKRWRAVFGAPQRKKRDCGRSVSTSANGPFCSGGKY